MPIFYDIWVWNSWFFVHSLPKNGIIPSKRDGKGRLLKRRSETQDSIARQRYYLSEKDMKWLELYNDIAKEKSRSSFQMPRNYSWSFLFVWWFTRWFIFRNLMCYAGRGWTNDKYTGSQGSFKMNIFASQQEYTGFFCCTFRKMKQYSDAWNIWSRW